MFCISADHRDGVEFQVADTGISDHTGQLCSLDLEIERRAPITTSYRRVNARSLADLKDHLAVQSWDGVLECVGADEAYSEFLEILTLSLNATCPLKITREKPTNSVKQVFDVETGDLRLQFLKAQNAYIASGRREDKERANGLKRSYDLKLRQLRRDASAAYISESSNTSKAVWRVINSERKEKQAHPDIKHINIDNNKIEDPVVIANKFNTFFTSMADMTLRRVQTEKAQRMTPHEWRINFPTSILTPTSEAELLRVIHDMKNKRSSGLDKFSSLMVKQCQNELIRPLLHVLNLSFSQGLVPGRMKLSKVIPLHKSGSRHELANYRPISLVSTFLKLLERVTLARIIDHLKRNQITLKNQHGFTRGKSTSTALVCLVEHILDKLEEGETVTGFFLDLSKAFDCLSHDLILTKLGALGFRDKALEWFRSYLGGRDQLVELRRIVNGTRASIRSDRLPVGRGVPQGSVLGPVLFILFTADLPIHVGHLSNTIMYADDTVLVTSGRKLEDLEIQSYIALSMAVEYCGRNDLVFNEAKTKQLNLGVMSGMVSEFPNIECVMAAKHLGVIVDGSLTWVAHLDDLCKKLSGALFALRRVMNISTVEAARITYGSLFECHLRYGVVLWGAAARHNLDRVLIIQKRAVRVLAGLEWRESCRGAFKSLKILTVVGIYLLEVICLAVSGGVPRGADIHAHGTRNARDFNLPLHHTTRSQRKPSYAGARFFNMLPLDVKRSKPEMFRRRLGEWLFQRPFYTISEYMNWQDFEG